MAEAQTIEIKLFATLRLRLGVASIGISTREAITVRQMIAMAEQKLGTTFHHELVEKDGRTLKVGTIILLDGKNVIHLDGLDTVVDTPNVAIFPPAGGG